MPRKRLALRFHQVQSSRNTQPHRPDLGEVEPMRRGRKKKRVAAHGTMVTAPVHWADTDNREASSTADDMLTFVRMAVPET